MKRIKQATLPKRNNLGKQFLIAVQVRTSYRILFQQLQKLLLTREIGRMLKFHLQKTKKNWKWAAGISLANYLLI